MLPLSQRIAFAVFAAICLALGARGFYRLYLRIIRGRDDADLRRNNFAKRALYALRTTLTQERVFRKRPMLSTFHAFIFYAFVLYILVNAVDAAEGFLGEHVFPYPAVRIAYGFLADLFSILAIVGVLAFVVRRFLTKRKDFSFNARTLLHPDIQRGYMSKDSIIVSAFIVLHVGSRITGNAAKIANVGPQALQPFSNLLAEAFDPQHALAWRIAGYWGALGSVLLFLVYFPYSKHIHILMAPLKYFFHREASSGELPSLNIDIEAASPELGAATLADLSWPRLLDSYACIQCNRCQDVCPASHTGKSLSPAALEINKRMAMNTIARESNAFSLTGKSTFEAGQSQGPLLLEAVLSPEAAWACTTCGACMEVCPTENEQMLDIIDIRRNLVMQQGEFPAPLQNAFRGMERNKNPWAIAQDKRMAWAEGLQVPTIDEVPDPDVLYWVGCAASYDASAQKTARAVVQLLEESNTKFAVLGKREGCTGDVARRAGNEMLYQDLARNSIATLQEAAPKLVLASCPHCVNTISAEYPQLGGNFKVMHHTEYFSAMLQEGKLAPAPGTASVAFHDPCYLGRHRGTYDQPRAILNILSNNVVELDRNRSNAFCCGAGGAQFWKEEEAGDERISENRYKEAQLALSSSTGEKVLAVGCPFCKSMLQSTPSAAADHNIVIKDVAELLLEGILRTKPVKSELPQEQPQIAALISPALQPADAILETSQLSQPVSRSHSAEDATALPPIENTSASSTSPTIRKKWVPKTSQKSPETAVVDTSAATTPVAETNNAALSSEQAQPENPSVQPAVRKKWQPKGKP